MLSLCPTNQGMCAPNSRIQMVLTLRDTVAVINHCALQYHPRRSMPKVDDLAKRESKGQDLMPKKNYIERKYGRHTKGDSIYSALVSVCVPFGPTSMYSSPCLPVACLSVCLFICLSVSLCVCPSVCLSVCLSVCVAGFI